MKPKTRRLWLLCASLISFAGAAGFILSAFQENLLFFYTPSDVNIKNIQEKQMIRLGGVVKFKSFKQRCGQGPVQFVLTDHKSDIHIAYQGVLPDLFREGQGVVVEGYLIDKLHFNASAILAKHDENYMPPQVAKALYGKGMQIKRDDH